LAVKDSTVPGCPSSFAVGLSGSWTRFSTACSETGTDVNGPTRSVNANNVGECGEFENTSIGRTRVYVRSCSPFMEYVKPSKPNVLDAAIVFFFFCSCPRKRRVADMSARLRNTRVEVDQNKYASSNIIASRSIARARIKRANRKRKQQILQTGRYTRGRPAGTSA